jgi:hypothetical protein
VRSAVETARLFFDQHRAARAQKAPAREEASPAQVEPDAEE